MTGALARPLEGLICVLVPCAIGAVMYLVFELWNRRRTRRNPEGELPPVDYTI